MQRINSRVTPGTLIVLALAVVALVAAGCGADSSGQETPAPPETVATIAPPVNPLAQAAAEATAIVQQAQATALVLQAEAQAAAMVREATGPESPPDNRDEPAAVQDTVEAAVTPAPGSQVNPTRAAAPDEPSVEIIFVGFAGEGGFIHVQFMAPPSLARRWNQGLVSVTDEETGIEYTEIPIMPVLGALIGKPMHEGQPGYVMLVNAPVPLKAGARVTVKLGNYIEEGVIVHG